jgi:hypothetical protein
MVFKVNSSSRECNVFPSTAKVRAKVYVYENAIKVTRIYARKRLLVATSREREKSQGNGRGAGGRGEGRRGVDI